MSSITQVFSGFPDGSSWTANGLSASGSYTTSSTPMFNLSPMWNFSSTANAWSAISMSPTVVPTGATAGNGQGTILGTTLGVSAVNAGDVRGALAALTVASGYTGTTAKIIGLQAQVNNSGAAQPTARAVFANYPGNGSGVTSGFVNNAALSTGSGVDQAVSAGSGGTVTNAGVRVEVNAGSGAGTTNNYGVHITGNGGSGGAGTTNNYALYSDSTAPSQWSGTLIAPASATGRASIRAPHGTAPSAPADGDMWTTTSGLFVRINGVTKSVNLT